MNRFIPLVILLTLIALPLAAQTARGGKTDPAAEPPAGQNWALVVGISDYTYIARLRYAHRDAEAFYQFLLSPAGGSVPKANCTLLTDTLATTAQIVKALDNLTALVKPGDRVVLYFAGHGDQETRTIAQRGFLLTHDTFKTNYMAGGLPVIFFQDYIATLSTKNKASVTVFLDACHAGKLAGNEYDGVQLTGEQLAKQVSNEVKLMACQTGEVSLEGTQWDKGHGVFTYHLIRGLQGLADVDTNQQVTLREMERYLEDHVSPEAMPVKQNPFKVGDAGTVLARVDRPTLTALKTNQPLPGFAPVEGRDFVDDILTKADTHTVALYRTFQQLLAQKEEQQAIPYYEQLMRQPALAKAHPFLSRDLAAALIDEAQTLLNNYLNSQERDNLSAETCGRLSEQLAYAARILGPGSSFYQPMLARSAFFTGIKANLSKDSLSALRAFDEAIHLDSTAAFVYNEQGVTLAALKNPVAAESTYRRGLRFAPNWPYLYNNLGILLRSLKRTGEAEAAYRKAIELKPDFAAAYSNLGNLLNSLKRTGEAEAAYRKAIELKPDYADAYYNLGILLNDLKRTGEAEAAYRKAIKLKPDYADAYYNLGILLNGLKRTGEAEGAYRKAIELKADYAAAYNNLGILLRSLKRTGEAEAAYRKAIELKPDYADAYNNLGILLNDLKRTGEAEAAYRKAIKLKPDYADAYYNLGILLYNQQNYKDAASLFKQYTELQPQDADGWNDWGSCLLYLNDFAVARTCFEKVAQLQPGSTFAPYNLACLYALDHKPAVALAWLERALQKGFVDFDHIAEDTDLDNIRQTDGFKALLKKYQPNKP